MNDSRNNLMNHRRSIVKTVNNTKPYSNSSSKVLKRNLSGHVPLLNVKKNPLENISNINIKRKINEVHDELFDYNIPTTNYASVGKNVNTQGNNENFGKRTKSERALNQKNNFAEDVSLRLITSTIQGMKYWTSKHLPYPILFEVFGKIDSQVTTNCASNTRQFSLIDEKDRVDCVFAEIDQLFSQVDRDVQVRIICRFDSTKKVARCVTIRSANENEWKDRTDLIRLCDFQLNDDEIQMNKSKKNGLQKK